MKINDYSYYRKNALSQNILSKELSKHREEIIKSQKNNLSGISAPILSAVVSVSVAILAKDYSVQEHISDQGWWIVLLCAIFSYLIFNYVVVRITIKAYELLREYIDERGSQNTKSKPDIIKLSQDYNNEIVSQVYLSYFYIKEHEIDESSIEGAKEIDKIIRIHYLRESFFNFDSSLKSLNNIFYEESILAFQRDKFESIKTYRIASLFTLLFEIYKEFANSSNIPAIDLKEARLRYNGLAKCLNETGFLNIQFIEDPS
jgi:hypothetical protein